MPWDALMSFGGCQPCQKLAIALWHMLDKNCTGLLWSFLFKFKLSQACFLCYSLYPAGCCFDHLLGAISFTRTHLSLDYFIPHSIALMYTLVLLVLLVTTSSLFHFFTPCNESNTHSVPTCQAFRTRPQTSIIRPAHLSTLAHRAFDWSWSETASLPQRITSAEMLQM